MSANWLNLYNCCPSFEQRGCTLISLSLCNTKTTVFNRQNLNLMQIGRKSPPLPFGGYSVHIMWCDITLPNHISCIIEHLTGDLSKEGKILRLDISISCNFQQLWFSWQKSTPPPSFLPFCERPSSHHTCRIPMSPYYKSTLRFSLSKYLLGYQLYQLFKILTYTEGQDTDHGAGGKPISSLTTIHTNIPAITVTVLAMHFEVSLGYIFICLYLINQVTDKTFSYIWNKVGPHSIIPC